MAAIEITEEQRDKMVEGMIKVLGLERKHPSKKALEEEIIDYLGKKHPCALGTCGKDGRPRISVVDYKNDGLTLYIMSEGGTKFKNIRENNRVAIGALLIVLQGMDTSGKDGTIKHVMSGVNPQGCKVVTFKTPSAEELSHDFLWRVHQKAPAKGQIGIFNRSHYEDVLITRVHGWVSDKVVTRRFNQIKEFEELLAENGTAILKFFLHISKDEQKARLEARIQDPEKRWKWNSGDLEERKLWDEYMTAFEEVIAATSTDQAPWYIVPANRKWYRNLVVGKLVVQALTAMKLSTPPAPKGVNFDNLQIR